MNTIALQEPELVSQITRIAESEGQSAVEFVSEAVRVHVARHRQKRIQAETDAWYQLPAETRAQYRDKFVAVFQQELVDSDSDRFTLFQRVRGQFGKQPVAIIDGNDASMPTYRVSSVKQA